MFPSKDNNKMTGGILKMAKRKGGQGNAENSVKRVRMSVAVELPTGTYEAPLDEALEAEDLEMSMCFVSPPIESCSDRLSRETTERGSSDRRL